MYGLALARSRWVIARTRHAVILLYSLLRGREVFSMVDKALIDQYHCINAAVRLRVATYVGLLALVRQFYCLQLRIGQGKGRMLHVGLSGAIKFHPNIS